MIPGPLSNANPPGHGIADLPDALALNAWTGSAAARGALRSSAERWGSRPVLPAQQQPLRLAVPVDPTQWSDPEVGYGVLLPDGDPSLTAAAKAIGEDAPQPIRDLLAARPGSVILRWSPQLPTRFLRRYYSDGTSQDARIGMTRFGVAKSRLPRFVLIVGGPDVIPWSVQFELSLRHAVGRLPLERDALGPYVAALLSGWRESQVDITAPVVWTVDHGPNDITAQMRAVIAGPLAQALTDPRLPGLRHLHDADATGANLITALQEGRPAFVATSSHGLTAPLDDAPAMRQTLGLPVDAAHDPVELATIVDAIPPGCVWYSQACCSAGSNAVSSYAGLLAPGSSASGVIAAVAALGSMVAPAALQLLGRASPARAVLGHVEPTFDWTLRVAETGQGLGHDIVGALSTNAFNGQPLGYAFADYRAGVGELYGAWADAREALDAGRPEMRAVLTRLRLTAMDRQSLVLLGDPTVTLPPLPLPTT